MVGKYNSGLVFALLLFGVLGCFSLLGDAISHTVGLRLTGIPITFEALVAGTPRTGHLALGYLLGIVVLVAGASLVGRALVLKERMNNNDSA